MTSWFVGLFLYLLVGFIYAVTVNVIARRLQTPFATVDPKATNLVGDMFIWPIWLLAIIIMLVFGLLQALISGTIGLIEYLLGGLR